jgi:glycosyltransferase involved in cell wall biosynthesis
VSPGGGPAFSVIVPAYNEETHLAEAVRSALNQTRGDFELVIVDDGSEDDTPRVGRDLAADPRVTYLRQENRGLSAARNAGIAATSAPLVSFLDSDDLWLPGYLEAMGQALEKRPGAAIAYCDAWWVDVETGRFRRQSALSMNDPPQDPPRDADAFATRLMRGNFIFVSATVRREALEAAGPFDTDLSACEDYDMWLRILAGGDGAVRAGDRLAVKRDRLRSMSRAEENMVRNLREVCRRAALNEGLPESAREIARQRNEALEAESKGRRKISAIARGAAARTVRRAFPGSAWLSEPPPEVAQAFPNFDWSRG